MFLLPLTNHPTVIQHWPTDHPSNSSSHTMAIHPEINETDEKDDTHINVITSLTTGSQSDRCVLTLVIIATSLWTTPG